MDHKLSPNESYTIISRTNYYYPILLIIFTSGIVISVQYLRIKVEVKESNPIKTKTASSHLEHVTVRAKIDM